MSATDDERTRNEGRFPSPNKKPTCPLDKYPVYSTTTKSPPIGIFPLDDLVMAYMVGAAKEGAADIVEAAVASPAKFRAREMALRRVVPGSDGGRYGEYPLHEARAREKKRTCRHRDGTIFKYLLSSSLGRQEGRSSKRFIYAIIQANVMVELSLKVSFDGTDRDGGRRRPAEEDGRGTRKRGREGGHGRLCRNREILRGKHRPFPPTPSPPPPPSARRTE